MHPEQQNWHAILMFRWFWLIAKNDLLKEDRGISFEDIALLFSMDYESVSWLLWRSVILMESDNSSTVHKLVLLKISMQDSIDSLYLQSWKRLVKTGLISFQVRQHAS